MLQGALLTMINPNISALYLSVLIELTYMLMKYTNLLYLSKIIVDGL